MLTREQLAFIFPGAREEYISAILDPDWGVAMMARFQITENNARLAGFLANGGHETNGCKILRESMNYKTPSRLRAVWPKRFGAKSDAELSQLCGNEKALCGITYGTRMGNRPGTDDGYNYRGGGFLQVTGRDGYLKYGKLIGVDFDANPEYADDMRVMFAASCAEWWNDKCNELCDAGQFEAACAKLNTGSQTNIAGCVGLADRKRWHGKLRAWLEQNPGLFEGEPAAVAGEHVDGDGDTVAGQTVHFTEMEAA